LYLLFWPHFVPGLFDDSPHSIYPFTILALQAGATSTWGVSTLARFIATAPPMLEPTIMSSRLASWLAWAAYTVSLNHRWSK